MISKDINRLVAYGIEKDLIRPHDRTYVINRLETLYLDSYDDSLGDDGSINKSDDDADTSDNSSENISFTEILNSLQIFETGLYLKHCDL